MRCQVCQKKIAEFQIDTLKLCRGCCGRELFERAKERGFVKKILPTTAGKIPEKCEVASPRCGERVTWKVTEPSKSGGVYCCESHAKHVILLQRAMKRKHVSRL